MIRRTAVAAACAAVALMLVPTQAMAKGLTGMTVTGPGLSKPISLGMEGSNELWPAAGISSTNPSSRGLGPKYAVTGKLGMEGEGFTAVHLDLYPLAFGGPRIYAPPGQSWPGKRGEPFPSGWWRPQRGLLSTLVRGGLGLGTAQVSGPGLAKPIRIGSGGMTGYAWATDLFLLIGEDPGVFGPPKWTNLGPRYVATVHSAGGGTLTQYLYPYARNTTIPESLVYTPTGQRWLGVPLPAGWTTSSSSLTGVLHARGLPDISRPAGSSFPSLAFLAGLAALALLVAAGATAERRRSRRTARAPGIPA